MAAKSSATNAGLNLVRTKFIILLKKSIEYDPENKTLKGFLTCVQSAAEDKIANAKVCSGSIIGSVDEHLGELIVSDRETAMAYIMNDDTKIAIVLGNYLDNPQKTNFRLNFSSLCHKLAEDSYSVEDIFKYVLLFIDTVIATCEVEDYSHHADELTNVFYKGANSNMLISRQVATNESNDGGGFPFGDAIRKILSPEVIQSTTEAVGNLVAESDGDSIGSTIKEMCGDVGILNGAVNAVANYASRPETKLKLKDFTEQLKECKDLDDITSRVRRIDTKGAVDAVANAVNERVASSSSSSMKRVGTGNQSYLEIGGE